MPTHREYEHNGTRDADVQFALVNQLSVILAARYCRPSSIVRRSAPSRIGRPLVVSLSIFAACLVTPACAEPGGVTQYVDQLSDEHKRVRLDIDSSSKLAAANGNINIRIFVGDVLDPIRNSVPSPIDGQIFSTNIQMNFEAASPNILAAFRNALPLESRGKIKDAFALVKATVDHYGQGVVIPSYVELPSGRRHFCFVVTDHQDGWSWEDHFVERNLQIGNIAEGSEQCFLALAPAVSSILIPTIGASQIKRGDNVSVIEVSWAREKHICRLQKAIRGILLGLARTATKIPPSSKLQEVGTVVYQQDVLRAVPDTRNATAPEWTVVR
jgi:hypothetical protein